MGEIADDMIDGSSCSLCGCYFQHPDSNGEDEAKIYTHGYPVYCKECYEHNCGFPKATVNTI